MTDASPAICPCCGYDLQADADVTDGLFVYRRAVGVFYRGERLRAPWQVHEILAALMRNAGRVLSKHVLAERLGYEGDGNLIEVRLCHARRVLRELGVERAIETIRGRGVLWVGGVL